MTDQDAKRDDEKYTRAHAEGDSGSVPIHMAITAVVFGMEVTACVDWTHETTTSIDYTFAPIQWFEKHCTLDSVAWYGPAGGPLDPDTLVGYLLIGSDLTTVWSLVASEFNFDLDWGDTCPF